MGIYDREYVREDEPGGLLSGRTMVVNLILANVVVFLIDFFTEHKASNFLRLEPDFFQHPWTIWQLVTYGFAHDPSHHGGPDHSIMHVGMNMLGLWFFGREIEGIYGRMEFLRIYLTAIVLAGLTWVISQTATQDLSPGLVGASGGVVAVVFLWIFHFPTRPIYIWFVIPVPGWVCGVLFVLLDVLGASSNDNVAHVAHLAGALFAFIYYRSGWNLGRLLPASRGGRWSLSSFKMRPKLRVHDPDEHEADLNTQVDQILEKISREGEASLTKKERKTLEEASKRYQRRRG
jgi:membrane associated rhomboid family serine protease